MLVALVACAGLTVSAVAGTRETVVASTQYCVITDERITESSGLAATEEAFLTVNDSGGQAVLYALDPRTCDTIGQTRYLDDKPRDVEALALAPDGTAWVADIGDNRRARESVRLYGVSEVSVSGNAGTQAQVLRLQYPDGPTDAESLAIDPRTGDAYIVSKGLLSGGLYRVAAAQLSEPPPETITMEFVKTAPPLATDAVFSSDGARFYVRSYSYLFVYDAATWELLSRHDLPEQNQGETLTVRGDDIFIGSEGARSPLLLLDVPAPRPQPAEPAPAGGDAVASQTTAGTPSTADVPEEFPTPPPREVVVTGVMRYWPWLLVAVVAALLVGGWAWRRAADRATLGAGNR